MPHRREQLNFILSPIRYPHFFMLFGVTVVILTKTMFLTESHTALIAKI